MDHRRDGRLFDEEFDLRQCDGFLMDAKKFESINWAAALGKIR